MAGGSEIVIDIAPTGQVTVEGRNFAGAECEQLTKGIEEALGETVQKERKPEYYERGRVTNTVGR